VYVRTYVCMCYVNSLFMYAINPRNILSCCHSQQHQLYLPLPVQSVPVTCRRRTGLSVCLSPGWDADVRNRNAVWRLVFRLRVRVGTSAYQSVCACVCVCVHSARFCCWRLKASIVFVPSGSFRKERLLEASWTLEWRTSDCLIQGLYFFGQILFCTSCRYSTGRMGVQLGLR